MEAVNPRQDGGRTRGGCGGTGGWAMTGGGEERILR